MSADEKTVLVMAGGTGGHIFPGLALARALRGRGWRVHWLGNATGMEARLVPPEGFALETIEFSGVRGKGALTLMLLPMRLLRGFWQSIRVLRRVRPDLVVGMGGYIAFPAGMMAVLLGQPLLVHEQSSVAGLVNRVLAGVADRVMTAFPGVLPKAQCVGNPLRADFLAQGTPATRFAQRSGPLRLLVIGGSLGARSLNEQVPRALACLPPAQRPVVTHQGGQAQMESLEAAYAQAGVAATLVPFIDEAAAAMAQADLIICRSGASTVSEIAAVGAAAIFVPFPFAVDDHQTTNARYLTDSQGGWLLPQQELTPERLAKLLAALDRTELKRRAEIAYALRKTSATQDMVLACEGLIQTKGVHA